jgi:hypothetical protein
MVFGHNALATRSAAAAQPVGEPPSKARGSPAYDPATSEISIVVGWRALLKYLISAARHTI